MVKAGLEMNIYENFVRCIKIWHIRFMRLLLFLSIDNCSFFQILYQGQPVGNIGFSICDSRMPTEHLTKICHCVVQYISPVPPESSEPSKKTPGFETRLTWLVISEGENN